jgi:uncharacterized tellurite resistance protein B-like protein
VSLLRFLRGGSLPDLDDGVPERGGAAETATIRRIAGQLEQLEPQQAAFLAGFAYVLARVAYSDLHISHDETAEMERIVREIGHLPEPLAVLVVEIAKNQTRVEGATEDFLVTRRFREVATEDQRVDLLHCLFAVASAAGDTISAEENHEIRQVAEELGFDMGALNRVRAQYAEQYAVRQGDRPTA